MGDGKLKRYEFTMQAGMVPSEDETRAEWCKAEDVQSLESDLTRAHMGLLKMVEINAKLREALDRIIAIHRNQELGTVERYEMVSDELDALSTEAKGNE